MIRRNLFRDRRGATIIEFAIVAPVMLTVIMGLSDLAYQMYAQAILSGAVQKAGRDSTIQGAADNLSGIDTAVAKSVGSIMKAPVNVCGSSPPSAYPTWCSTRLSYSSFSNIKPEPFTDANHNGKYDPTECFTDTNGNNQWDAEPGISGSGGANDAVLYTMRITYPRIFPVMGLLGWPSTVSLSAQTLLKNQPYATQSIPTVKTVCPK